MIKWYIDSLDGLGGIAFASHRDGEPKDETPGNGGLYIEARQTVFIAAPFFAPEPVSSRAIALAARRGAFQSGFYIDNEEQGFDTVEHVAEFVRRIFVGGGGNGPAGGQAPGAPPGPPQSPEGGELDLGPVGEWGGASELLWQQIQAFQVTSETAQTAVPFTWALASAFTASSPRPESIDPLLRATRLLFNEINRRWISPTPERAEEVEQWYRAVRALIALLARVGVWPDRFREFERELEGRIPRERLDWLFAEWRYSSADEPFEAMRLIPIPSQLFPIPIPDQKVPASLADLLSVVSSSPRHVTPHWGQAISDLIFFAAAAVVASPPFVAATELLSSWRMLDAQREAAWINVLAPAALAWCERSFPQVAFPAKIENAILGSPTLRYAAP